MSFAYTPKSPKGDLDAVNPDVKVPFRGFRGASERPKFITHSRIRQAISILISRQRATVPGDTHAQLNPEFLHSLVSQILLVTHFHFYINRFCFRLTLQGWVFPEFSKNWLSAFLFAGGMSPILFGQIGDILCLHKS